MTTEQHLLDAVAAFHRDVARFQANWITMHAKDPDNYPMKLYEPEWFDQFMHFISTTGEHHDN